MKRMLIAAAILLAACSESPTQPAADLEPQFAALGVPTTWYYEGYIFGTNIDGLAVNDAIKGKVTFTFTTEPFESNPPCMMRQWADARFEFTVGSKQFTIGDVIGAGDRRDCNGFYMIGLYGWSSNTDVIQLELSNGTPFADFPLVPPALVAPEQGGMSSFFFWNGYTPDYFQGQLTYLGLKPRAPEVKNDCFKDGWKTYGFKNQGQCVKYIETGVDTR